MGKPGKKASNIYQNPGVANNKGVVEPKLPGVGSPGKFWPALLKMAPMVMGMMGGKGGGKKESGGGTTVNNYNTAPDKNK